MSDESFFSYCFKILFVFGCDHFGCDVSKWGSLGFYPSFISFHFFWMGRLIYFTMSRSYFFEYFFSSFCFLSFWFSNCTYVGAARGAPSFCVARLFFFISPLFCSRILSIYVSSRMLLLSPASSDLPLGLSSEVFILVSVIFIARIFISLFSITSLLIHILFNETLSSYSP